MMSDEHGRPDRGVGAHGADDLTDGESPSGTAAGYSGWPGQAATPGYSAAAPESWPDSWPRSATGRIRPEDATSPAGDTSPGNGALGASGLPGQGGATAAEPSSLWDGRAAPGGEEEPDSEEALGAQDGPDAEEVPGTGRRAPGRRAPGRRRLRLSAWAEIPILVVVALAIALVIKTFVVQPFFIPSSSMENTLLIGDKVLVNKLVYHFRSIEPGDIIVFNGDGSWNPNPPPTTPASNPFARAYDVTLKPLFSSIAGLLGTPADQTDYIKRVIGVPGDRVACCNAQHLVTVNGVPLHEQSYLYPGAVPSEQKFNIVVPPGRLWVMGDNRAVSSDSRLHMSDPGGGSVPENQVIGRAFVIIWPPSRWGILSIPATFQQPGVDKPRAGAAREMTSAAARRQAADVAQLLGSPVRPETSYLPLVAGLAGAVPLTWLQRRARRRAASWLRRRRTRGHS
jgi:signal peptidase I